MKRIIVRIQKQEYGKETYSDPELLELPGEEAAGQVVANLIRALKLPTEVLNHGGKLQYWLVMGNGDVIPDFETLTEAGVRNDTVLTLHSGTTKGAPDPARVGVYATLKAASGTMFDLKPRSLVGRSDSELKPEVDLGPLPDGLTVSRKHAYIERSGTDWFLVPLETKNVTRLAGQMVPPNTRQRLNNGDEIDFGKVKTVFKLGRG